MRAFRLGFSSVVVVALLFNNGPVVLGSHGGGGHGGGGGGHGGGSFSGGHGGSFGSGYYGGGGGHYGGFHGGGYSGGQVFSGRAYSGGNIGVYSGGMGRIITSSPSSIRSQSYNSPSFVNRNFSNLGNVSNGANRAGIAGHQVFHNGNVVNGANTGTRYHGGNMGGLQGGSNAVHQHSNYWQNNSYFFGNRTPFGNHNANYWHHGYHNYGNRYPWYGIGIGLGYGFPWYGLGGFRYGGYGYYNGYPYFGYQSVCSYETYNYPASDQNVQPAAAVTDGTVNALDFAGQGERDFQAGQYREAVRNWRHAIVEAPGNGAYVLLLGQALFATGDYNEAAGATQLATQMLPQENWGVVVANYKQLYTNIQDYTNQLRALEKARDEKPEDPALRFLLGWHYGYLGYPKEAVRELDKAIAVAPKDEVSQKVREIMAAKLGEPVVPPAAAEPPLDKPAHKPADKPAGKSLETET